MKYLIILLFAVPAFAEITFTKDGGLYINGLWMNQAFVESFIINPIREYGRIRITIKPEDVSKWSYCLNPKAKCVRYEKWQTIKTT